MFKKIAIYKTMFGYVGIAYQDGMITEIKMQKESDDSKDEKTELTDSVYTQLQEYFHGERKTFSFPMKLKGTDFQRKVWNALCTIPYGETRTYKEIASAIGNPKASRAVGMANNKNPIPFVVPCHRVIGANGSLVGYAYGIEMKKKLLELEQRR